MNSTVSEIYRYPVKGLSADALASVNLTPGETLPFDRVWAIENGPSRFDPEKPAHLPKVAFLMLMRDERLATLEARFDEESQRLTLLREGRQVASGDLTTRSGRQIIEQFLGAYMHESLRGPPRILRAEGHSFSDTRAKRLHIVNRASVHELERVVGRAVDPLRFRPNVVIDGLDPWAEMEWVGREISVGSIRLRIAKRTDRCAATNVDPQTGIRDMDVPAVLQRQWGHIDFGVYAEVLSAGRLSVGDPLAA